MKAGKILLLLGILLIGIIIYVNKCGGEKSEASLQKGNAPSTITVSGFVAASQPIEEKIYSSGTLIANEEVEIRNEIAGKITSILFKEGSQVKKGDLLVTIYDKDLRAQLKKLLSQKDIAEKSEERQKDLLAINGISQQEYEVSESELTSINADIELVKSNLSKTKIQSPFDGIIGLKAASAGSFLAANTRIATIQQVDPMKLDFSLPERYRPMIKDNSEINFTTESTEGIFTGKIFAFEPKIDLQTRSVLVRAICPNPKLNLFPGAFAHVEIPLKKLSNAILIPTQALVPELKGQNVFVSRNGKAEKAKVETGIRNDTAIQITSGIAAGDTILVTGLMQMRPGMSVKVNVKEYY
jgi:membrane fusion protein (multidrug efflux system)